MLTLVDLSKKYNKNEITLEELFAQWGELKELTIDKKSLKENYPDLPSYSGDFNNSFESLYYLSEKELSKENFNKIYNKLLENSYENNKKLESKLDKFLDKFIKFN